MKQLDVRDLTGGLVLVAVGLFATFYAQTHYEVGTPARMGPGFFPVVLGWVLAALGAVIVLFSLRGVVHVLKPPPFKPRPLAAILVAVVVFSASVGRLGLVPATTALVFISALAGEGFRWKRTALLAVALCALSWLIFVAVLRMPLSAFAFQG